MKTKLRTRIAAALAAAAIAAGAAAIPAEARYNNSATSQVEAFTTPYQTYWKYCEMYKFPAGKYWNGGNADSWTNTPCNNHNACNWVPFRNTINKGYTPLPAGETFGGLIQCYGFARKLATDFYGGCQVWVRHRYSSGFQFRVGDQVRINNDTHSVFITEVNGNSIKFADCNWDNRCGIRWDVSATITNGRFRFGGTSYQISYIDRAGMAGDINGDSKITIEDVHSIEQIYRGVYTYGNQNRSYVNEAADLDNDGRVTYYDSQLAWQQYDGSGYFPHQRFLTGI